MDPEAGDSEAKADESSYLRKLSKSLRKQLSKPVSKTVNNPMFDSSFDGAQQSAPTFYRVKLLHALLHRVACTTMSCPCGEAHVSTMHGLT